MTNALAFPAKTASTPALIASITSGASAADGLPGSPAIAPESPATGRPLPNGPDWSPASMALILTASESAKRAPRQHRRIADDEEWRQFQPLSLCPCGENDVGTDAGRLSDRHAKWPRVAIRICAGQGGLPVDDGGRLAQLGEETGRCVVALGSSSCSNVAAWLISTPTAPVVVGLFRPANAADHLDALVGGCGCSQLAFLRRLDRLGPVLRQFRLQRTARGPYRHVLVRLRQFHGLGAALVLLPEAREPRQCGP